MAQRPADPQLTPSAERHAELPELARRYADRALAQARPTPEQVEVTQTGTMWSRPGARPSHFTATERLAVTRTAFWWSARFRLGPVSAIKVHDSYDAGQGALRVQAFGLPVRRSAGPDLSRGEAYRYLAELPWVPHAIACNDELEWRAGGDRTVEVSRMVNRRRVAVTFEFDAGGDIFAFTADARPMESAGRFEPTPWGGELSDYRILGGVRLPTRGEVYWNLPEGRFVYWRGLITGARLLDRRFTLEDSG